MTDATQDPFSYDTSEDTAEDVNKGGGSVDKEGWYHFEVNSVDVDLDTHKDMSDPDSDEKTPSVCLTLDVLKSVNGQSPEGSRMWHRIYVAGKGGKPISEGGRKMLIKAALRTGLLREVDGKLVKDDGTPGVHPNLFKQLEGMQLIAEVKLEKGSKGYKDRYVIPFQMLYQVDDPDVAKVPKNEEMLALAGKSAAAAPDGDESEDIDELLGDDF